jgi:hypothetical protein
MEDATTGRPVAARVSGLQESVFGS